MQELTFIACRRDGLGERLRGMLNAMIVAEMLGGRFTFHWPGRDQDVQDHAIPPPENIFSKEFIDDFYISSENFQKMELIPLKTIAKDLSKGSRGVPDNTSITVDQSNLARQSGELFKVIGSNNSYRDYFERVGFSDNVEHARDAARKVEILPNSTGIHLRAGDIINGKYRYTDKFHHKVLSIPLASKSVEETIKNGGSPIVFTQDDELSAFFREHFLGGNVILASDERRKYEFSTLQQAMFDIFLMARCERIVAGHSGFARVASQIADIRLEEAPRLFEPAEAVQIIEDFVFSKAIEESVPPLHLAFACRSAFHLAGHPLTPVSQRFQKLLDRARALDPENDNYHFTQACVYYEDGAAREAESLLEERVRLHKSKRVGIAYTLKHVANEPSNPETGVRRDTTIERAAEKGWPMAALCVAVMRESLGNYDEAAAYAGIFTRNSSEEMTVIGKRLLRKVK